MKDHTISWHGVEDCLTLDIRSPMTSEGTLRPVLVDMHGGGLMTGAPDIPYGLRNEGFVVVGIRYRLNVLGFLALQELTAHDSKNASGNYGFSDQVTALRWVQHNVKAFGGDPSRVTIIGCSSGGTSVWNLLAIPAARGLFARAIPLSAASRNNMTLAEAQHQNKHFVDNLCGNWSDSADIYKCLIDLSLERVMNGLMNLSKMSGFQHPFDFEFPSPAELQAGACIVDGIVVQEPLHAALSTPKEHSHVPVLSGSCSQEGNTHWLDSKSTVRDFENIVNGLVKNLTSANWPTGAANRIIDLYPPASSEFFGLPRAAMDAMIADIRVVCGTIFNAERLIAGRLSNVSRDVADIWLYYSDMRALGEKQEMRHCTTMHVLGDANCSSCNPEKHAFHANMIRVHSEFIKTGAPPAGTLRKFADTESYTKGDYMLNIIAADIATSKSRLKERCDFWRDTNVLEQYAWDELKQVFQTLAFI